MPTHKAEKFVDLVRRSGLVDDDRLNAALSGVSGVANESGIICASLIKAGLLTEWQSERLLEGRHRGFFLGKYKLLDHLGTGGMSAVYLAEHRVLGQLVAVKVLPQVRVNDASYLARFYREARAGAALNHRNIVRTFDADHDGNVHYLVMEYVDGLDVQQLVKRDGPLDYRTAADFTRQAAEGLAHAHAAGMIHRDIKPSNLLIDNEGTLKILDLGLARVSDDEKSSLTILNEEKVLGTVDYLAPEQAVHSHHIDSRADLYSLGCTLYFMLTGRPPFPEGTMPQRVLMHQTAHPESIRTFRPDAPPQLVAICNQMMAKKPDDRFQSAKEVSEALTDWLEGKSPSRISTTSYSMNHDDLSLAPLDDDLPKKPAAIDKRITAPPISSAGSSATHRLTPSSASGTYNIASSSPSGASKSASGSGIKSGQQPAAKSPAANAPSAPGASQAVASANEPSAAPAAPAAKGTTSLLDELLGPSEGEGAAGPAAGLDALLDEAHGPAVTEGPVLRPAPMRAAPKRRNTLWDHTWFLILVGLGLGFLVLLVGYLLMIFL